MKELLPYKNPWMKGVSLTAIAIILFVLGRFYWVPSRSALPRNEGPSEAVLPENSSTVSQPTVPARDAEVTRQSEHRDPRSTRSPDAIAWLEELGKKNSVQAISWALTESDSDRRAELVQAALRGWASIDCDAAANWALHQNYAELGQAMSAVFNGANRSPERTVQLAERLGREDPAHAADYGSYLIFALGAVGEYSRAAAYAGESSGEVGTQLLTSAYTTWARREPGPAVQAALQLQDGAKQRAAFQAALGGWAQGDPEQLTKAAVNFPEGEDRRLGLTAGLRSWIEKNPDAAAEWISQHKFMPEMEAALEE